MPVPMITRKAKHWFNANYYIVRRMMITAPLHCAKQALQNSDLQKYADTWKEYKALLKETRIEYNRKDERK
jgi:hypothetical protein